MESMEIKKGLFYSETHEWVEFLDDGTALIGLTDFAQKALTALVFVELPRKAGRKITNGKSFGNVESYKAVSPLNSQLSGTVVDINQEVDKAPEKINEDPYGAWLVKVGEITEKADLMDSDAYEKYCEEMVKEHADYFEEA